MTAMREAARLKAELNGKSQAFLGMRSSLRGLVFVYAGGRHDR
jgi:hypothetical protein